MIQMTIRPFEVTDDRYAHRARQRGSGCFLATYESAVPNEFTNMYVAGQQADARKTWRPKPSRPACHLPACRLPATCRITVTGACPSAWTSSHRPPIWSPTGVRSAAASARNSRILPAAAQVNAGDSPEAKALLSETPPLLTADPSFHRPSARNCCRSNLLNIFQMRLAMLPGCSRDHQIAIWTLMAGDLDSAARP